MKDKLKNFLDDLLLGKKHRRASFSKQYRPTKQDRQMVVLMFFVAVCGISLSLFLSYC